MSKAFKKGLLTGSVITGLGLLAFSSWEFNERRPREFLVMRTDGVALSKDFVAKKVRDMDGLGAIVRLSQREAKKLEGTPNLIIEPILEYTTQEKPSKPWFPWPWRPKEDGITNPLPKEESLDCRCKCKKPKKPFPPDDPPEDPEDPEEPEEPEEPEDDPERGTQVVDWGQKMTGVPVSGVAASEIIVCVVDTGIDKRHPDLRHIAGKDFTGKGDYHDGHSHGTHVAGIIAALNNDFGVIGASQAKIVAAKVLSDDGRGSNESIAAGVNYCNEQGANILNLSLGGPQPSKALEYTLQVASQRGALIFVAAGNESSSRPSYPAAYRIKNLFSISALDRNGQLAGFSNWGKIEATAPGVDILSTVTGGGYKRYSGTSMASPLAAGIAALYMSVGKPLLFEDKGDPVKYGQGMISARGLK